MSRPVSRRQLGRLCAVAVAAVSLAGCSPARSKPTPEALQMAEQLAQALRAVPGLTDVTVAVQTHVYTEPEIFATAKTLPRPARGDLLAIGDLAQAAVDAHQLAEHHTSATLTVIGLGVTYRWDWHPTTASTPTTELQVDAALDELGRGPHLVTVNADDLKSRWSTIDDGGALHPAPPGMRSASRWLRDGLTPASITVSVFAGEQRPRVPFRKAIEPLLPVLVDAHLGVVEGQLRWQLFPDLNGPADQQFIELTARTLGLWRDADFDGRQTVEYSGPWWVTLAIDRNVSVLKWRSEADRTASEPVINELMTRVNR